MQKYRDTVLDKWGNPIEDAEVAVTLSSDDSVATIYSDNGVTETPNPIFTDENGQFEFYAANGLYDLTISGRKIDTAREITNVQLEGKYTGSGSPEGVVTGFIGEEYTNTSGGASTTLYVKTSGNGTNTGWTAK